MQMSGEQTIAAPRARVWEALNDPDILRQCIPGCQSLERESAERMKAIVAIKLGPIGARFAGAVTLSDIDPPNGYTLTGEGQGGAAGFAKGSAHVSLAGADGSTATILRYTVDVQVGGRMAQLGGAIIDHTAKQLSGTFFKRFGEIVGAPAAAPAPVETIPAAALAAAPELAAGAISAAAPAPAATYAPSTPAPSFPMAWVLAMVVAALVGFLVGSGGQGGAVNWQGLAIGLLVALAGAAGFTAGRRAATPMLIADPAMFARAFGAAERRP
ncbi:MAG: carbon monoxide dehydrogenase subunit G [Novosphingobium sp.]|nr:carbon monoxide dehydrogenase subunit G [Novosphingobium sp.]